MKKTRLLLFTLLLALLPLGLRAQDLNYTANDRVWKCKLNADGTAAIIGVTEAAATCSGVLNIPDAVIDNGGVPHNVTTIQGNAFNGYKLITEVNIPASVKTIVGYAFYGCEGLTKVGMPGVKSIGCHAFRECTGLTTVDMPGVEKIDQAAFDQCSSLSSVDLTNVKSLGEGAFMESGITSIIWGHHLIEIPARAFEKTLVTSIAIPAEVKTIGGWAFYKCPELTTLHLEEGLEEIGREVFRYCGKLTGDLTIPSTVKNIYGHALEFHNGGTLTIKAQRQQSEVGNKLGSVFKEKNNLAFSHVVLEGPEPTPLISQSSNGQYIYPVIYQAITSLTIDASVKKLSDFALYSIRFQETGTFDIPSTVEEIGRRAFEEVTFPLSSTHITIHPTVTKIGSAAFGDTNITRLTMETTGITEVPTSLCCYCQNLTEVNLPADITKLGDGCFNGCVTLANLTLPTGVTEIGNSALSYTALVNLPLPEGLTTIGKFAFANCHVLTTITPFPSTLTTIGDYAFLSCTKLQGDASGFLPASLKRIGAGAFADNKGITGEAVFPQMDPVAENDDMVTAGNPFLNTSVYGMRMGQWDKYFAPNESNNVPVMWNDYSGLLYIDARDCTVRLANGKGEANLAYKFARHDRDNIYKNFIATSVNTLIYLPSEAKFNDSALPAATFDQRFDTDENEWEGDAGANFIMDGKCELFYVSDWCPYRVPIAFTAQTAMYDREFNVTDGKAVSTLYLPYPTDLPDGMQAYTLVKKGFDEHGDKAFIFREVPLGTRLSANTPYIVRITDGQTHKLPVMHNVEVPVSPKVTGTDSGQIGIEDTDWKFYGTTEKIENAEASAQKAFYLNGNKWWAVQDGVENDYIAPFRCFVSSPTGAAAAKNFVMVFEGEEDNTVTGIKQLENDTESDIKSGKYPFYSVDGKLMGKDYDKLESGQIYIVNGKKFYKF